jgi:PST family polysaccharide transporter
LLNSLQRKLKDRLDGQLISNFIALFTLQGLNYILPLITIPYLVRVLGVEIFGLLAFATAFIMYFQVITDYGFQLSATKEISIYRNDKDKIVEIFSAVMTIKAILLLLSFIFLIIIVFSFERLKEDYLVYLLTFGMVAGQAIFPVWFFQGMEKMKYITYVNIISKSLFAISIFIFVRNESDYHLVPLLTSVGFIISGVLSLWLVKKEFGVKFKLQGIKVIEKYAVEGWHVFVANIYTSLYTTTNVVLLGLFTNNTVVGYYSIAEKIVGAIAGLFIPVNQVFYPYLARKYCESKYLFNVLIKRLSTAFLLSGMLFFIVAYSYSSELVYLVSGENNQSIEMLFVILLFRVLSSPFSNFFSNILIIMKENKKYLKVMTITVILNMVIVFPSIYLFSAKGLTYSFVLLLYVHTFLLYRYVKGGLCLKK